MHTDKVPQRFTGLAECSAREQGPEHVASRGRNEVNEMPILKQLKVPIRT
jgi:hypothetical protein